MKIQCNVCAAAEATVLCCADEAALCRACDQKVHAANKLASKHQRVPLSNSASQLPKCDICQEIVGYFFCLQDRALLCRKCDVAIHTANTYVSTHQRFLLTGVKVASEAAEPGASSAGKLDAGEKILETKSQCVFRREREMPITTAQTKVAPLLASGIGDDTANKASFGRRSTTVSIPQWQFDEFLGLEDSVYLDDEAFKVDDSCKIGALNNTPDLGTNEEMNGGDFFLKAAEDSWMVPQIPSPPTASDLYWPDYPPESAASVPDICFPSEPNIRHDQNNAMSKRRRHLHWFDP